MSRRQVLTFAAASKALRGFPCAARLVGRRATKVVGQPRASLRAWSETWLVLDDELVLAEPDSPGRVYEDPAPLHAELRRREAQLGPSHPAVAEAASTLAILYNQVCAGHLEQAALCESPRVRQR